jgi:hypothetical protein
LDRGLREGSRPAPVLMVSSRGALERRVQRPPGSLAALASPLDGLVPGSQHLGLEVERTVPCAQPLPPRDPGAGTLLTPALDVHLADPEAQMWFEVPERTPPVATPIYSTLLRELSRDPSVSGELGDAPVQVSADD